MSMKPLRQLFGLDSALERINKFHVNEALRQLSGLDLALKCINKVTKKKKKVLKLQDFNP